MSRVIHPETWPENVKEFQQGFVFNNRNLFEWQDKLDRLHKSSAGIYELEKLVNVSKRTKIKVFVRIQRLYVLDFFQPWQ